MVLYTLQVVAIVGDQPILFSVNDSHLLHSDSHGPVGESSFKNSVVFSPDDERIVFTTSDNMVKVMSVKTGKMLFEMKQSKPINKLLFTADGKRLLTAGFMDITIWSTEDGSLMNVLSRHDQYITNVALCKNDEILVSTGMDNSIIVWDFKNLCSITAFYTQIPVHHTLSVASDLSYILYGPQDVGYLAILEPNPAMKKAMRGEETQPVTGEVQEAQAYALAFSSQKVKRTTSAACVIL